MAKLPMPHLRLETITTSERLQALRPQWEVLWERCLDATPFQAPEWLLPWWEHLGHGLLCTLALWEGERLVGLAPLYVQRYFGLPLRRLVLIGTGNTDYLDVLLDPEFDSALPQLVDALEALSGWDFCDFQQLRSASPLLQWNAAPLRDRVIEQEVCPVLALSGSSLDTVLPTRLRSNLRYYGRKLEGAGGSFEITSAETVVATLDALFELHGARWRRRKLPGVFTSERVRRFHHEAARGFAARGWLRLHRLTVADEVRAALYCFTCRGRGYYYAGGFDPMLSRNSPGTVLTGRAIQSAATDGAHEFDFLRGDEPYKYNWGAVDRINRRRIIWSDRTSGSAAPLLVGVERGLEHQAKRFARWLQERQR
jgi:CelD/BcsL family acetyltransferase involved in cellulose biosynthesis